MSDNEKKTYGSAIISAEVSIYADKPPVANNIIDLNGFLGVCSTNYTINCSSVLADIKAEVEYKQNILDEYGINYDKDTCKNLESLPKSLDYYLIYQFSSTREDKTQKDEDGIISFDTNVSGTLKIVPRKPVKPSANSKMVKIQCDPCAAKYGSYVYKGSNNWLYTKYFGGNEYEIIFDGTTKDEEPASYPCINLGKIFSASLIVKKDKKGVANLTKVKINSNSLYASGKKQDMTIDCCPEPESKDQLMLKNFNEGDVVKLNIDTIQRALGAYYTDDIVDALSKIDPQKICCEECRAVTNLEDPLKMVREAQGGFIPNFAQTYDKAAFFCIPELCDEVGDVLSRIRKIEIVKLADGEKADINNPLGPKCEQANLG